MSEIREEIKSILKKINKKKKEIEEILKKKDREYEMFFMNLYKEIIIELKNLNKENTNEEPKKYFLKYDKNFLYQMIKLFIDMKKNNISNEAIESVIIIKENIEVIITISNNLNKNINENKILDEEITKFNNNIINLIIEFMNLNQKILIDCFLLNKDNNLHDFLLIFSKYKNGRNFLYDCERIIFLLYADYENYKIFIEFMNYSIDSIYQQLNEDSFLTIMEEIQIILYIYKNHISIISNSILKLLIKIFIINEKIQKDKNNMNKNNFNQSINNLLRYCFDRVVFIYSDNMNINSKGNNEMKNKNKFKYNKDFMNFLLKTYSELITQKLKNSYSDFLMELFLGIDNIGIGTKKYIWLVNETDYPQTVLQSLIDLKDYNLLSLYFSKILFLSVPNLTEYYIPEYDIKFFISKLDMILNNENEEENEKMLNIISSQIINLININKINIKNDIIDILINKCSLINTFILIINSDNYSNNIKNKLINFVENIFSINNNNIKFSLNIPITNYLDLKTNFNINDVNTYGIKYKIYLLSLEYSFDITEYHNKLNLIINNIMCYYLEKKKIIELILFGEILLKSILIDNKFKCINELSSEIIEKINNIYIQASTILFQDENIIESDKINIINKFIYQIIYFIREFNKKCFQFKKNNLCKYNQLIFHEDTLTKIFNNIFMQIKDFPFKQKFICNIFKIYSNEDEINQTNNNKNNNYILESSFLIIIILKILFKIKDYQSLLFLYTNLLDIINFSSINIKIILRSNIISITTKLLFDLYINKLGLEENDKIYEECFNKAYLLLNSLIKFSTQSILIQYLDDIFNIFYDIIFDDKNDNNKYKQLIMKLFLTLKDNLNISSKFQKQNYQYLSISKKLFNNPFIYNIFCINNIKKNEDIIHFNMDIRINSYNSIDNFYIFNFINEKKNQSLFILINNKNQLIVGEKSLNKNQFNQLALFENINNYLLSDNYFHNVSIIIDIENKYIKILIDYKNINPHYIIDYNNSLFDDFSIIIGYDYETVDLYNSKNNIDNCSIIDISNILIINYKNDVDNYILNTKKDTSKKQFLIDNILNDLFLNKKEYYYKFILADICFNNNDIKIINSNKYIKNISNSYIFNKYLTKDKEIIKKYISYIEILNPFLDNNNSKLHMISKNDNIENYFSSNGFLTIQNINKVVLQNIFSENFNIIYSSSNNYFIDFMIGFLYNIDKRKEYFDHNTGLNNETNNMTIFEDENINDYIIIIFEIILNIPNKKIINYFLYENENISIKIKYFFKKNIYLLNNKLFLMKLNNLLNNKIENLLIFTIEIFIDLLIFPLIDINSQNIILINIQKNLENKQKDLDDDTHPLLMKMLEKIYDIILYHQLSELEIAESNNEKQLDIFLKCILLIFEIIGKLNIKQFDTKIMNLTNNIINICSKYYESVQTHDIKSFLKKHDNIFQKKYMFIDNNKINNQIEFITNSVSKYFAKLLSKQRKKSNENNKIDIIEDNGNNIIIIDSKQKRNSFQNEDINCSTVNTTNDTDLSGGNINDLEDNADEQIINSKNCCFCSYLFKYFKINFDSIYEEIEYEKYKKKFYRYIFINFNESKTKLGIDKYTWYLSENESGHRSQNKFFVKENKIKIVGFKSQINDKLYKYKYINDLKNYNKNIVQLQKLFIYDNLSIDQHFIFSLKNNLNSENNIILCENCLLIKNIQKTNCLLLIYSDFLLILKNICIDNENKLHVAINDFNMNIWCIKNEEYISELDEYIKLNEKEIIKNYFDNKEEKNNENNVKEFGFNKNYKFSIKILKFSEINEIHKVSYLQIPNSIEIITNKGKNYFLCFNIERRDIIFFSMINNIANLDCDKIKKNKKKFTISKKINKANPDDCFYMKHCPINYLDNSKDNNIFSYIGQGKYATKKLVNTKIRINKKELYNKAIIDKNIFLTEIASLWAKNRISNFDYLMLLNTLSGRSLINLSQYFIFPLILKDFNHRILNWLNKTLYRDLSIPIFACYPILKNNLSSLDIKKFELNEIGIKYHSGTFYSTHAFVSYYLIRQHPFTEIHLEIQGGEFDFADRLFIGTKELSNLEDKQQELIPSIYTLPELYINTNKFIFGKIINSSDKKEDELNDNVNDFVLPKWAEEDPRKFTLVLRKILESKKVNQNLNYWIDLIFGFKMTGSEAIKSHNTFRKACYELNNDEIEQLNQKGELLDTLLEKQELGYMGRQLIKKQHRKKEVILNEFKENENMFFDTNMKLRNTKLIEINKEIEYPNDIIFKVNNIMIETNNEFFNNSINNKNYYYHQGGLSSLKTVMNTLINEYYMYSKNINLSKLINSFEKESKFVILGKKNIFLGDPLNNVVLQYNKRIIKIIYNKYNAFSYYYLNEIGNISVIISNLKGTKLYIGIDNGNILIYKIKYCEKDKYTSNDPNFIYPFKNNIPVNNDNNNNNKKRLNGSFKMKRTEINNNITEVIILEKIKNNNFTMNNPHIPQKIKKLCLDEENNTLIATTSYNMIYIISLNNNFKLMHKIPYFTQNYYNYQYKIKDIVPLYNNGDFLIYSPLTVHLFTINGIPICELNLLDKGYNNIEKITYCVAVFIYDVILFTAHKNGSIYIWKVKNKNNNENFDERESSIFNNDKSNLSKLFLPEYDYCYSFNFNINNIKDFEIQRKFDIVSQIKTDKYNSAIRYMKMSNDMSYMVIINENKNIFILSSFEEDNNANINNNDNGYLLSLNKKKKAYCSWCSKEIEDCYYRASYITSIKNIKNEDNNDFEIIDERNLFTDNEENIKEEEKKKEDNKKSKDYTYICEECKQKLGHVENYLYNY